MVYRGVMSDASRPAPARSRSRLGRTSEQALESDSDDDHKAALPVKVKRGKVTRKPLLAAATSASGHGQVDYTVIYMSFAICWHIKTSSTYRLYKRKKMDTR